MKIFFIISLLFVWSTFANAGNPGEDPVVGDMTTKFVNAKAPTIQGLHLGAKWKCMGASALDGDFDQRTMTVSFKSLGSFIKPVLWSYDGSAKLSDNQQIFWPMTKIPQGMVGQSYWYYADGTLTIGQVDDGFVGSKFSQVAVLRMTSDGALIIEISEPLTNKGAIIFRAFTPSAYSGSLKAIDYWFCPKSEPVPHEEKPHKPQKPTPTDLPI